MNQQELFPPEPLPAYLGVRPSSPASTGEARARRTEPTGEQLKREGQGKAAESKSHELGYARELAFDIARNRPDRCCHMGLVNANLAKEGRPSLGNSAGSVFLSSVWVWTGERVKDERPQAHANEVKVWRLKDV